MLFRSNRLVRSEGVRRTRTWKSEGGVVSGSIHDGSSGGESGGGGVVKIGTGVSDGDGVGEVEGGSSISGDVVDGSGGRSSGGES